MNYKLLFKIKQQECLQVVISKSTVDLIQFNGGLEKIEYSPNTLLEENQCYEIKNFSGQDYSPQWLKKSHFAIAEYPQWETKNLDIEFILNTNGKIFYFQKFIKSQLLQKSWFSLSGEPNLKDEKIITINAYATAYYNKKSDCLLFKKLDDLKRIFSGIETLYREATKEEIEEFFNNNLLNSEHYSKDKIGVSNRKRIVLVKEQIKGIKDKVKFCSDLKKYYPAIEIVNQNTIKIKTEEDLKNILYALDERFYTTDRGEEKRLANSIIKIP